MNINQTRGIKFICRDCGAEWMIPLSGGGKVPERCIYCGKSVPHLYIQRAIDEITQLKDVCHRAKIDVTMEANP